MVKQSRNRERGKAVEKEIARMFNGKRVGILGSEDVSCEKYSLEVKSRKRFVGDKWMRQCIKNNRENKIPLVVVHQANSPHTKDLVMINIMDFLKVTGVKNE